MNRIFIALGMSLLVGVAAAQNSRLAWTRTDASVDISLNTVRHALVNNQNQLVAVGRSPGPNGVRGNITIFNRNRAVVDFEQFGPPGGGDLELTKVFEYADAYLVAGTATPTGSTDQQIYLAILDRSLNMTDEIMFAANNGAGEEIVTDLTGTSGHRWVCGRAMATNGWRAFAYHLTGGVDNPVLLDNLALSTDLEPQLTYDVHDIFGAQQLFFAANTPSGPTVKRYDMNNILLWTHVFNPTGTTDSKMILDNVATQTGDAVVSLSWNTEPTPGVFASHAKTWLLSYSGGIEIQNSAADIVAGANNMVVVGSSWLEIGSLVRLTKAGTSPKVTKLSSLLTQQAAWTPTASVVPRNIRMDAFGETAVLTTLANTLFVSKLNTSMVKRYDIFRSTTLTESQLTTGLAINSATGDIFMYGSDDHHMSLSCIEQAPIAITDAYPSVRRNVFYRAPVSVLNNDRYATGTTITIHTAPAHGTVTMGADGIFNYTSVGNYVGPEQFRYQISRPGLATATAWVNFNIVP